VSEDPSSGAHGAETLASTYYDGHQPIARPVLLRIAGDELLIEGEGVNRRVPRREVRWPERQRHGARLAYLPGQGLVSHADGPGWDAWAQAQGLRDSTVVRWMQSWRAVGVAIALFVAIAAATWAWGIPALSSGVLALLPPAVDETIGEQAMASIDAQGLRPSKLPSERQAAIRQALDAAVAAAYPSGSRPAYSLQFRAAGRLKLGPNAFALPGGRLVLTDELAELLADAPDVTTGVLAHELGHIRHRHGMRMVVQASVLAVLTGWLIGDFSSVLAAVPAVLGQQSYARDFEREADDEAIAVLRANRLSPGRMAVLFERLAEWREKQDEKSSGVLPIAFADHPADEERTRRFRDADTSR
jgi:Zn-dependent protease with chaperone function